MLLGILGIVFLVVGVILFAIMYGYFDNEDFSLAFYALAVLLVMFGVIFIILFCGINSTAICEWFKI